ncbi:MAG TPA: PilZ domain-containing protein [Terracidiphilus sp.]|jgi:c-di-GMP-binding flagellar brake protein YcgR|nr:PilZ domain-containing protein [Terracidiphilus sp.]
MEADDKPGPPPHERRKETRLLVDGKAVLTLLDTAIHLRGHVIDLSHQGCQFRTEDCFPMGIYRRVEIEFQIEGLPFRLAGVTQSLHKPNRVGVRFLDMSERKRVQLQELIEELRELELREAAKTAAQDGGSSEKSIQDDE